MSQCMNTLQHIYRLAYDCYGILPFSSAFFVVIVFCCCCWFNDLCEMYWKKFCNAEVNMKLGPAWYLPSKQNHKVAFCYCYNFSFFYFYFSFTFFFKCCCLIDMLFTHYFICFLLSVYFFFLWMFSTLAISRLLSPSSNRPIKWWPATNDRSSCALCVFFSSSSSMIGMWLKFVQTNEKHTYTLCAHIAIQINSSTRKYVHTHISYIFGNTG